MKKGVLGGRGKTVLPIMSALAMSGMEMVGLNEGGIKGTSTRRNDTERFRQMKRESAASKHRRKAATPKPKKKKKHEFTAEYHKGYAILNGKREPQKTKE